MGFIKTPDAGGEVKLVHIGMVTFNRIDYTRQSIQSVARHTRHPYILTVVDNGSRDGTRDYLRRLKDSGVIRNLVLLEQNTGVAKAVNLAWLQEPGAEYFMKLDNDMVIQKTGWLSPMVEVLEHLPLIGVLGYNVEPRGYARLRVGRVRLRPKDHNIGGACFLIPRRTEQLLGYFNEGYGLYGEEDADYGARVKLLGLWNAYMDDQRMMFHLPAGRAAHIDPCDLYARDGKEEVVHAAYRHFKDDLRRGNLGTTSDYSKNIDGYRRFHIPFYVETEHLYGEEAGRRLPFGQDPGDVPRCRQYFDRLRRHDLNGSLEVLETWRDSHPGNPWFRLQEGLIHFKQGDSTRGHEVFKNIAFESHRQLLTLKKQSGWGFIYRDYAETGNLYRVNDEKEQARYWLEKAALHCPGAQARLKAGYYFTLAGLKADGAREDLERGIQWLRGLKKKSIEVKLTLGRRLLETGKPRESKTLLLQVVQNKRADREQRTRAYFFLGEAARQLNQSHWRSFFRKGLALLQSKEKKQPIERYRVASMYKQIGDFDQARGWFEALLAENTGVSMRGGIYFHLGEMALKQGHPGDAHTCFGRCLELLPHHAKAALYIKKISSSSRSEHGK
jgi:glycosyltransferase involved in cell wall biosynthesis